MPPKGKRPSAKLGKSKNGTSSVKIANKQKSKQSKRDSIVAKAEKTQHRTMMQEKRARRGQQGKNWFDKKQQPQKAEEDSSVIEAIIGTSKDNLTGISDFLKKGNFEDSLRMPTKKELEARKKKQKEKMPKPQAENSDSSVDESENEYEKRPRQAMQEQKILPVRSEDGKWIQRPVPSAAKKRAQPEPEQPKEEEEEEVEAPSDSEGYDDAEDGDWEEIENEFVDTAENQQQLLAIAKRQIAEVCSAILQDPETNLKRMDELHNLCNSSDQKISLLAQLSEAEVLGDLIPMYRIRLPTAEELKQPASKEVAATRAYESRFLNAYTRFVNFLLEESKKLLHTRKQNRGRVNQTPLDLTVCNCLCTLLQKGYHFNCRKEIITALTPLLNSPFETVREATCKCLGFVFANDTAGDCSLEIVRIIARIANVRGGSKVKPELFRCLLDLPLSDKVANAVIEKKVEKQSKKERRRLSKQGAEALAKDLKESEGTVSLAHKKAAQTALLTEVFTIYFRVLKTAPNSKVLPLVLQGVAKFAMLINVELLLDLLELLKQLAGSEQSLSVECKLRCVVTSLACLEGKGATAEIDLKEFNQNLYSLIFDLLTLTEQRHMSLLLQSLTIMLQRSLQLSLGRVASFMKRMGGLALFVPVNAQLGLMHIMRYSFNKYPKLKQLLDSQSCTPGAYQPELPDPEHANAFASTLWELPLLSTSHHPEVKRYATCLLKDEEVGVVLAAKSVQQVYQIFDVSQGGFNPAVEIPESLKTQKSLNKGQRAKRKVWLANAAREESESDFIRQLKRQRQGIAT